MVIVCLTLIVTDLVFIHKVFFFAEDTLEFACDFPNFGALRKETRLHQLELLDVIDTETLEAVLLLNWKEVFVAVEAVMTLGRSHHRLIVVGGGETALHHEIGWFHADHLIS